MNLLSQHVLVIVWLTVYENLVVYGITAIHLLFAVWLSLCNEQYMSVLQR